MSELTEAERAYLAAGHAYCAARRDAYNRAQQGTQQDADRRAAIVQERVVAMLGTVLALEPRSPRDRESGGRL
jgi:hypothetical protein